jgi:uncharacterized protein (TIGR03083 family)
MTDQERLAGYVDVWWQAVHDFTALLEHVPAEQWSIPTDLDGWDVHAVAAHVAHLEGVLAGAPEETVDVGEPTHVRGLMGLYTEQGVVARAERTPDQLINEIREAATARHTQLLADPPVDGTAQPSRIFGGIGWDWEMLLQNRPIDVWMHDQDVRRAVDRPGGMETPAAHHTVTVFLRSLGRVVAKGAEAPAGTTVVLEVDGHPPAAVEVADDGRGVPLAEPPEQPTLRLTTGREPFILLAGGRRAPEAGAVRVEGDAELGRRVLDAMAVTP